MAAIPFAAPQVLDLDPGPAEITLPESPDPNALVAYVFFDNAVAVELHVSSDLDEGYLHIDVAEEGASFPVGPFPLNSAPRFVDAGAGAGTACTVQVLRIVP